MVKTVSIWGSTGSVGKNTLDVINACPHQYQVQVLTAHQNVTLLAEQARACHAQKAIITRPDLYADLKDALAGTGVEVAAGENALCDSADMPCDWTMSAIVGMAGIRPLMGALMRGKTVAVANKEPLVAAGSLIMDTMRRHGAMILPVDSEHNALFQILNPAHHAAVTRLILTASGGPFRTWKAGDVSKATIAQALAHPNWQMGKKISIDSATMMNKALEVIEAHHLFTMPAHKIDVVIHPQSIIHSMVEYNDGSILAQMGSPDMRVPISYALNWPERQTSPAQKLDIASLAQLSFEPVTAEKFPALGLAYDVLGLSASHAAVLNAANEVAVEAFLRGMISFADIYKINHKAVTRAPCGELASLEDVLMVDCQVRDEIQSELGFTKGESHHGYQQAGVTS